MTGTPLSEQVLTRIAAVPPRDLLLITDFDGTLAPIVPFPAQARAVPGALGTLSRLADHLGAVVLLTGRSRASLLPALGDELPGGVRILCNYGADDPSQPPPPQGQAIDHLLSEVAHLHAELPEGVMIEEKGTSIALHTRGCRDPEAAQSQIRRLMEPVARTWGLDLQPGRDVIDIGLRLGGKAATVTRLLGEREWGAVLMFGDDHSDLDAFDVLAASPVRSVTFGVVSAEVEGVVERSDITVESPHEVAQILSALLLFTAAAENAPR